MVRMMIQAKLSSFRHAPIYQLGYRVPRTPQEAIKFDNENNNTRWQDAMALEMEQLQEYKTFKDLGVVLKRLMDIARSESTLSLQQNMLEDTKLEWLPMDT